MYTLVACFNDTASQQTMSGYPQASLIYSDSNYLVYLWTSQNDTDVQQFGVLFSNAGNPGYPIAGTRLASKN